jgi:hypothetical protein
MWGWVAHSFPGLKKNFAWYSKFPYNERVWYTKFCFASRPHLLRRLADMPADSANGTMPSEFSQSNAVEVKSMLHARVQHRFSHFTFPFQYLCCRCYKDQREYLNSIFLLLPHTEGFGVGVVWQTERRLRLESGYISLLQYFVTTPTSDAIATRHSLEFTRALQEWCLLGCYAVWLL